MSRGISTRGCAAATRPAAVAVLAAVVLLVSAAPVAGQPAPPAPAEASPSEAGELLAARVTLAGVNRHLIAFQRLAWQSGGTRAAGTPGFDASADYVAGAMRAAGFDVSTPSFEYLVEHVEEASFTVGGGPVEAERMQYSASSPAGGVTGPLLVVPDDATPGCELEDYDGLGVAGSVAVIGRGSCSFAQKQAVAGEAGAVAAIIVNNVAGPLHGTLGDPSVGVIPTMSVTAEVGATLVAGATATVDLRVRIEEQVSHNVIAQTRTGRPDNVVMLGAHLDSVPEGPGINDNGTGSAALMETALRLGGEPDVDNAVRFAWWGAEEYGLIGSTAYVGALTFDQQLDIALYLNFDMIGSPNAGYFVYDGDDSDGTGAGPGPYGSAQLETTLADYLHAAKGVVTQGTDFDGRSDYGPFIEVGIPSGGIFTGAEGVKTPEQAELWGGTAGEAYDPCYHQACDHLGNVDRQALDRNADAVAFSTGLYAASTEEVNGLPPRAARADLALMAASAGPSVPSRRGHHHRS